MWANSHSSIDPLWIRFLDEALFSFLGILVLVSAEAKAFVRTSFPPYAQALTDRTESTYAERPARLVSKSGRRIDLKVLTNGLTSP
jgi:hypothetical protein